MVKGPDDGSREPFLAIITYDQETDRIVGRMDLAGYQALGGRYRELPTPNMVEVSPSGRKVIYHLGRCWGAVGTATNWLVFNHPIHVAVLPDVDELISRVEEQDTGVSCREAIGVPDSPGSFFHDRETHQLYLWCSDGAAPSPRSRRPAIASGGMPNGPAKPTSRPMK